MRKAFFVAFILWASSASASASVVSAPLMDYCVKAGSVLAAAIGIRDEGSPESFAARVIHSYGDMTPLTPAMVKRAINLAYHDRGFLALHQTGNEGALSVALTNACLGSKHPYDLLSPQTP